MKWLIIISLVALSFSLDAADENPIAEDKDIKHISEVFDRLNPILLKNHLAPLTFTKSELLVFHPENLNRRIKLWEFQTLKVSLDFLPDDFELLSLYRNDFNYVQGNGFDQAPKPTWTEDKAIAAAKEYAAAAFNGFPKNVGPPTSEFEENSDLPKYSSVTKYYPGTWHIRWPRIDAQGHHFDLDSINVRVSEDQGLISAAVNFFSKYEEPQGPLISQDEALKIGGPAAESLVNKWMGHGLQLGPYKIAEGIVNPNHILQAKSMTDFVSGDITARLAWLIVYDLMVNGVPVKDHRVQVWVDAQTKEVIGGDFH